MPSLRDTLDYSPVELAFGTSGLRGLVADLSQLEAYVNTRGFLAWLRRRRLVRPGDSVCCAGDLRPSTDRLVPGGRGEVLQAALRAVADAGLAPAYLGPLPTPALLAYAIRREAASVMVTGSHIPFDRNGIKYNKPAGEVLKADEASILAAVAEARTAEYLRPAAESLFDAHGMFKAEHRAPLPPPAPDARGEYVRRYTAAFPAGVLAGQRILVYEHSAVGRDILTEVLRALGAEVLPAGRSETFVPIDTEAVDEALLAVVQALLESAVRTGGGQAFDTVVSTDGDGDRPLVLAVEAGRLRFVPGDLLGLLAADFLGARAVAVPVSANDAVEEYCRERGIRLRCTRIGSPHVVAALEEVGWEANGGFLTAVPLRVPGGGSLAPLPTRDALLPILCALSAAAGRGESLGARIGRLPPRFTQSVRVRPFPRERFLPIARWLTPALGIEETRFGAGGLAIRRFGRTRFQAARSRARRAELGRIRDRAQSVFNGGRGFAPVAWMNWLDGVRIGFADGGVAHLRASGNAPELRVYANAGSPQEAVRIAARLSRGGILEELERRAAELPAFAAAAAAPRPLALRGAVQHYDWGGSHFLPELIGQPNPKGEPWAELWLGAHPRAPAAARLGEDPERWVPLDRLLREAPAAVLGRAGRFQGEMPFLLKVLDAANPLSIQAHPSRRQAQTGFARENAAGLPLDSPERSYRDGNPKPEVHAALSELWMLHGFRPLAEIAETLSAVEELGGLFPEFGERLRLIPRAGSRAEARQLLRELYVRVMSLSRVETERRIDGLLARLRRSAPPTRDSHEFWVLRAAEQHRDPGVLSIYLLNLVHLRPGQGTFQPAGTLHAYLEGTTVELMANSDNVLRGGLTAKRVDVPELLNILDFGSGPPSVLEPRHVSAVEAVYPAPVRAFRLSRIVLAPGPAYSPPGRGPSCLLAVEGSARLRCRRGELPLDRGASALVPAGLPYEVHAAAGARAVVFRAGVP